MHLLGGDELAHQRPDRAGKDLDVGPAGQFADFARVLFGQRQRHVARHRGNAQHLQFRARQRQKNGDGIVLAGIGVDDDLLDFGHVMFLVTRCL